MFLTLLIVTQAVAEWVEISQQRYRKPIHTYSIHNPFTTQDRMEVEENTKTWIYNNKSVSEYNWSSGSKIQSNIGNPKQVQSKGSTKSAESVRIQEDKYSNIDGDEFDLRTNYETTRSTVVFSDNDKLKGIIEKVPNIGNVKRVQLNYSPVKSPVVNIKSDSQTASQNRFEELPLNNEQRQEVLGPKKKSDTSSNRRRIYVNKLRNRINTERLNVFPVDEEEDSTTEAQVSKKRPKPNLILKGLTNLPEMSRKPTYGTHLEDFIGNRKDEDRFLEFDHGKIPGVTKKKQFFTTPASNINESTFTKHNKELQKPSSKQTYNNFESKTPSEKTNNLVKTGPSNKAPETEYKKNHIEVTDNQRTLKKGDKTKSNRNSSLEVDINNRIIEHKNISQDKVERVTSLKGTQPENKLGNMDNLLNIMKVVADTISQNTRRSFGGKMRYLHKLKDSILETIAERIDATWPDDETSITHRRRRSRSTQASARGHHVQFPSSESALMTISFLTFAVFLIKLVLQIIHTYKNKSMMVAPLVVSAAGRTVLTHHGHH